MTSINTDGGTAPGDDSSATADGPKPPAPRPWYRRPPMIFAALAALIIAAMMLVLGPYLHIHLTTRSRIHQIDGPLPESMPEVALVLGARVFSDGRLSAMLEDRVAIAVQLHRDGRVKKLLMSGDNGRRSYDEVTAMRREAMRRGVPGRDILRDFAGFRTYDSLVRARDVFGQTRLAIVTQEFHLPRALYLARALGIDAIGIAADRRIYQTQSLRRSQLREIPACWAAVIDVWTNRPPKLSGPPEPLDGDAQTARFPEQHP